MNSTPAMKNVFKHVKGAPGRTALNRDGPPGIGSPRLNSAARERLLNRGHITTDDKD